MIGELGSGLCLDGLKSLDPALWGMAILLLRSHVGYALPAEVLGFHLQVKGLGLPLLPDLLPARNVATEEDAGEELGAS